MIGRLPLTRLGDVRVLDRLGEGGRSTVFAAELEGREAILKLYKASAIVRHARKHPKPLAEYEHERNRSFHEAPGLAPYVARPLAYVLEGGVQALVQERLHGTLYYFHHRERAGAVDPELAVHLRRIVDRAHEAGLYDVDLHAMNVMVCEGADGRPIPRLFDFNLIPFHVRPPNPLVGLLLRTGLMSPRHRDLRKLRRFHDFRRVEAKLLRFYPEKE